MTPDALTDRLARVRERISAACARAGRRPESVRIVVATKTSPPERLRELAAAGCRDFGENRIQEALPKIAALADPAVTWHFIGHLQTNKAKSVPGHFTWLHALDSADLARTLERRCHTAGTRLSCLIEVNIAGEPQKSGIFPEKLHELLESTVNCPSLSILGLMTIAPLKADERILRSVFSGLRELGIRYRLPELSMGMSDDFEVAVEEGATLVRLGRALLGDRP